MAEPVIWGIHPGAYGEAENLFIRRNVIAIGWREMGDLSQWSDREAYRSAFADTFPDQKPGAIPTKAGQLYRFVHRIKVGDFVVCPLKLVREVRISKVRGHSRRLASSEPVPCAKNDATLMCQSHR